MPRACAPTTHIAFQSHTGKLGQPPPMRQTPNSRQQRSTSGVSNPRVAAADSTQWCHSTTQYPHRTSTLQRSVVISLSPHNESNDQLRLCRRWRSHRTVVPTAILVVGGSQGPLSLSVQAVLDAQSTAYFFYLSQIAVLWPPLGACSKMSEGARLECWIFGVADLG